MSAIVRLVQGSAEWHEHRRAHRNASETPIVLGVSPWQTPCQPWQHKLGLAQPGVNAAMLRGTELAAIDLERRRGAQRQEVRVTTTG